jgi:hypothetical protein
LISTCSPADQSTIWPDSNAAATLTLLLVAAGWSLGDSGPRRTQAGPGSEPAQRHHRWFGILAVALLLRRHRLPHRRRLPGGRGRQHRPVLAVRPQQAGVNPGITGSRSGVEMIEEYWPGAGTGW